LDEDNCHGIGRVVSLAFSADGKRIMMGTDDGAAVIADAVTGAEVIRVVGVR